MSFYQHQMYGEVLSEIRKRLLDLGVKQRVVAKSLGISQASVSALLSGKSRLNLDQFLGLCELAATSPQNLLRNAEVKRIKIETMSKEMEEVLYKSELHLIVYCAAVQEIDCDDVKIGHVSSKTIESILAELAKAELLVKNGSRYVQKYPNITFGPSSLRRNMETHLKIISRSVKKHLENLGNKEFSKVKFNWTHIDRFTTAQIKEMESLCWRVYEKFDQFQKQNALINYVTDEPMDLWNLHVMIMPLLD